MQFLPTRQKLSPDKKLQNIKRTAEVFSGTFPEIDGGCSAPQNTPRDGAECREGCTTSRQALPKRKHLKQEANSRPASVNEIQGGCGRLSVSPNMQFIKIPVAYPNKKLPPIATVQDWRELSPELLKRDAAWNILCKHCPRIGANSRKEYFRRIVRWRNGIINENERRNCLNTQLQKITSRSFQNEKKIIKCGENTEDKLSAYPHHYFDEYAQKKKTELKKQTALQFHVSRKKEMLKRKPKNPPPSPYWQLAAASNPVSPPTPRSDYVDEDYTNCKVARYLQMYVPNEKPVHVKCKPLGKIYEPACQSVLEPLRLVYNRKCLPGILQKKSNTKMAKPPAKEYPGYECKVDNLGLVYSLPEGNPNVGSRNERRKSSRIFTNEEKRKKIDTKRPVFPNIPRLILPNT